MEYVLIFVVLTGTAMWPMSGVAPIYFHTKESCERLRDKFNEKPKPTAVAQCHFIGSAEPRDDEP